MSRESFCFRGRIMNILFFWGGVESRLLVDVTGSVVKCAEQRSGGSLA